MRKEKWLGARNKEIQFKNHIYHFVVVVACILLSSFFGVGKTNENCEYIQITLARGN